MTTDLDQAKTHLASGAFADALELAKNTLADQPEDQDGLYIAAVACRYLGAYEDALDYLTQLKASAPEYGRAFQEEGHIFKAQSDAPNAFRAYQMATRYNPTLFASWDAQIKLLRSFDAQGHAEACQQEMERIKTLPKALLAATNHLYEGRIFKAEELTRAFMQANPKNVEGMRLLAEIGTRLGVHEDAEFLLETAIMLAPNNTNLRVDLIQTLKKRQKFAEALAQAKYLFDTAPDNPTFQSLYAIQNMQVGEFETALEVFENILESRPNDPITLTSYGHALKTCGRTDDAVNAYRTAAQSDPNHGEAWYGLANLKTYTFGDSELETMQTVQANTALGYDTRIQNAFALAKAYEDRQDFDKAFDAFEMGNALKNKQTRYTSEQMLAEFDAQRKYCGSDLFDGHQNSGCAAPDPIFIVGLPRAGSTLIEQILASHSQVDGTLELPDILSLVHRLRGRNYATDRERYPRLLGEITPEKLEAFGKEYIDNTRLHRQNAPFFTDKMPNNFRHLGLIHLILPNAKIIDARRDPMDCCWSCFKQLFAEGQEFTYGLSEIGSYYRAYVDLMAHWENVLPKGRILRVQHEDVLDDLEGQVRRILAHCNLPFEAACINFHQNDRVVRTASSEQVRQKINRKGQGQWQPYEAKLGTLKTALGDLITPKAGASQ